jgi:uncharacterized protein (TIGR02266 family)
MDEREYGGQRKSPRVAVNMEFRSIEQFVREYVSNISSEGAFIVTKNPLPVGTKVSLRFTIFDGGIKELEGEGEVVRTVQGGAGMKSGMGVVFTELSSCSRDLIKSLVTRTPKKKPVVLG